MASVVVFPENERQSRIGRPDTGTSNVKGGGILRKVIKKRPTSKDQGKE
ncbi:hypothetical protein [Gluconobacter aidae]|nr:hypothetical protein [Gluconobacter aidae]